MTPIPLVETARAEFAVLHIDLERLTRGPEVLAASGAGGTVSVIPEGSGAG